VDFVNKTDADNIPEQGLDKKIKIKQVTFDDFDMVHFLHRCTYTPVYPEPWYSQQDPLPPKSLPGADLMGWNGRWQFSFASPVFPWIHRVGNISWVWPID
jgi:hypothetical protein